MKKLMKLRLRFQDRGRGMMILTDASMTIDERVKSDASQQIPMKETLLILKHD